ncbi:hypothetical protein [Spirosoma sordidisoli]|uniref:Uncharacterized protein n=1 Tax=Spirosoma sordidisoli TaxID=2502893 RepID=A0A4Q2UHG1_9BACT|nr:hypothetical protein [Spirosoma sordidisoli]RYC68833.1 hypothetical protein EQG79_15555 [Spirosoma sordidisoli]
MRTLLLLFFATVSFGALAQRSSYNKNVTTDGRRLQIRVDIRDDDRSVHYSRSFDVRHMSRAEVQALEKHVLDSLDVAMQDPDQRSPSDSRFSQAVADVRQPSASGRTNTVALVANNRIPYQETVEEDLAEGRLKVRFTFKADGQDSSVERSATIRDNSERGLRKLLEDVKRQLKAEMEELVALSDV